MVKTRGKTKRYSINYKLIREKVNPKTNSPQAQSNQKDYKSTIHLDRSYEEGYSQKN